MRKYANAIFKFANFQIFKLKNGKSKFNKSEGGRP